MYHIYMFVSIYIAYISIICLSTISLFVSLSVSFSVCLSVSLSKPSELAIYLSISIYLYILLYQVYIVILNIHPEAYTY